MFNITFRTGLMSLHSINQFLIVFYCWVIVINYDMNDKFMEIQYICRTCISGDFYDFVVLSG